MFEIVPLLVSSVRPCCPAVKNFSSNEDRERELMREVRKRRQGMTS